jgi:hypothetical protein
MRLPERDSVSALERSSKWPFAFLIVLHTIAERLHGRPGKKHRTLSHPRAKGEQRWLSDC